MKILLLAGWYFPDSVGGTETYVRILAKEFQSLGHQVQIAAPSLDHHEQSYAYDGLEVYRYPISAEPSLREIRGEIEPEYFDTFKSWLKQQKFDVIHQHSFSRGCGFYHAQYIKEIGLPLVFTAHVPEIMCARGTLMRWGNVPCDGEFYETRCTACVLEKKGVPRAASIFISHIPQYATKPFQNNPASYATVINMKYLLISRHKRILDTLNAADHIVTVAYWLGNILQLNGIPTSRLSVSKHGLPDDISLHPHHDKANRIGEQLRIGYIGRFDPVKGIHILIEAAKQAASRCDFELLIYGKANGVEEEKYLDILQHRAKEVSGIRFAGEVTVENRTTVMNNLDILAVPSIWLETGPFVVLEAFAYGIPVLGSNLGGIPEIVRDGVNGFLMPPGDINAWAKMIEDLSEHPEQIHRLQEGIPPVRSSKDVAQEMLEIYQNISKGYSH